jgi:hypothetical protein
MITGYALVAILGGIGYWLVTRRGWIFTGILFIAGAGLTLVETPAGPHALAAIQSAVNGIATGIQQL